LAYRRKERMNPVMMVGEFLLEKFCQIADHVALPFAKSRYITANLAPNAFSVLGV